MTRRTLAERFFEKVDRQGDCWLWTAATNEHGYGIIRPEGKRTGPPLKAHRVSLQIAGVDVGDAVVRHSCDNPRCVNPAHLMLGTQRENVRDMIERGRGLSGVRNGHAYLTAEQVSAIYARRSAGERGVDLAREFGTTPQTVCNIYKRRTRTGDIGDAVPPLLAQHIVAAVSGAATVTAEERAA